MCLIGVALDAHPDFPLILIANRDEFHARPTAVMHWWSDEEILAGRDQQAGGTWLGLDRAGRLAAVTNYRQFPAREGERSRGEIPTAFLHGDDSPAEFAGSLARDGGRYSGFNTLFGTAEELWWFSNRGGANKLGNGVHGLSNHLLGTPWPKVTRLTSRLQQAVNDNAVGFEHLLPLLHDQQVAPDASLPDTGLDVERERMLSAQFIVSPDYGTRSSTLLKVTSDGDVDVVEVTYDESGQETARARFQIERRD